MTRLQRLILAAASCTGSIVLLQPPVGAVSSPVEASSQTLTPGPTQKLRGAGPGVVQYPALAIPDPVQERAPRLRLHPQEQFWPMSSHTFTAHSDLRWNHSGLCDAETLDTTPNEVYMSGGLTYAHRTKSTWPGCNHEGQWWVPNQTVRPREDGGPDDDEGLFMNLNNGYHDGDGFNGDEPVYYRYSSGGQIIYWFHYGFSQTLNIGSHEGDWERIAIRLDANNNPQEVEYFQHHERCTLPWGDAPKASGNPIVWVAKEAHGSYPAGADAHSGDRISGDGNLWTGIGNLDDLPDQAWYGYGGGWGEVGSFSITTGPDAPPHKSLPTYTSPRCDMN